MIPIPILYGKVFRKWKKFLDESQWWSKSEIEEFQLQELSKLLNHAYENVPYYRSLFNKERIKPSDIDDFDKLTLIPPINRKIIQNNILKLKAQNYSESKFIRTSTSGSTTQPLTFFLEKGRSKPIENAFHWRYRNMIGINYKDEYIYLTGINLNKYTSKEEIIWKKYIIALRILVLSSFHLTDHYLEKYVREIMQRPRSVLFGFPSSLYMLAKYMDRNELVFENIKVAHTGSENLYPYQRTLMQNQFGTMVFDHYGHAEQVAFFHQCENANLYHITPEYGITEILEENGTSVKNEGKMGEIYATGFINYAFPLIRYKTGDIVEFSGKLCKCGRNFQTIKSIQGRIQEFFVGKTGKIISLTAALGAMHGDIYKNIEKLQFHQDKKGEAILKIVPKKTFKTRDEELILKALYNKMQDDVTINIEYLDNIPRTHRGKYIWIDQKLPLENYSNLI